MWGTVFQGKQCGGLAQGFSLRCTETEGFMRHTFLSVWVCVCLEAGGHLALISWLLFL